ncbi:hypothetical protein D3C85_493350 [compost metagenome]
MILFTMLQADAHNVYKRGTPLHVIICDGWARGCDPEQTLREASNAGYAQCIVEPEMKMAWTRMEAELNKLESRCTARPAVEQFMWTTPTPIFVVQHEAAKLHSEWIKEAIKHMSQEELERFCLENGFVVPEPKEKK